MAGEEAPCFTTDRSAEGATSTTARSVLLSGFGSGVLEETEAVLVSVPAGVEGDTVPRMVRTMEALLGNVRAG